ncbi:LysR family transcriptional regulator [Kordiimonas sp. SCSIO 12603]|uniref:LysR family transcriptional regulator n=1 Tax=Kordiimonas sp. SCSIO 12603 TaxID=2829596 RepID=UPI0021035837|nr:LysR family transcriptional regulator [Kordiimonas sp. SCSIO 12603]UTW58996.1 LysR family transcriptional regulator [Kordiimonas sp. SCSIO 12603]
MDFVSLRTFCRAVEEGNLSAAAKAVHVTKSVASRRIHMLEDDLGTKLLVRTTKGVSATDAGALFYERAINILADIEDAKQTVTCASKRLIGNLRVTAPRSFTDIYLSDAIAAFMKEYPDLTLELNLTDERVDIVGGGYDVGLRISTNLEDTSLIAKKLTHLNSMIAASPEYLEKHGTPKTVEDLKNHNFALYSNIPASRLWKFMSGDQSAQTRVNGNLTSNSGVMQLAAAKAGLAIVSLPTFFYEDAIKNKELIQILPDWALPELTLYALYPDRRLLPMKVRAFMDFMANWFAHPEYSAHL